ncbi:hypothetical protein [Nonomuraea salmonea]|uniref:hypothetical protein n=1 Tax=Nonomuraea salmonea TaxID=46181 RepID=UPI0031EF2F7A
MAGVAISGGASRNWSISSGGSMFEQGGTVADNRTEAALFDGDAKWTVQVRTGRNTTWSDPVEVTTGKPGDSHTQRIWVWHSAIDPNVTRTLTIPADQRRPGVPNQAVLGMTGLEEALEALAAELGGDYTKIGTGARDNLRRFVVREMQLRFAQVLESGLPVNLAVQGMPDTRITATAEVVEEETELLGGWTRDVLQERVLTETATSTTRIEHGGSIEGKVAAKITSDGLNNVDVLGPLGDYSADSIKPEVKAGVPISQSSASTANEVAVHPQVDKSSGMSVTHRKQVKLTFTVERAGRPAKELDPFLTELLVRQQAVDAWYAGDPVPVQAFVRDNGEIRLDADGLPVPADEPAQEPITGRRIGLPDWLGAGEGRLRGAGPTDVREIRGLGNLVQEVIDKLEHTGLVSTRGENGRRVYSDNLLVRAAQQLNEDDIKAHLQESALRSGFDQLTQGGVIVPLQSHGVGRALDLHALHIVIRQDEGDTGTGVGQTHKVRTHLDIASDTSGRGINRSVTKALGGSLGKTDGPGQGEDGVSHSAGVNVGGDRTFSAGTSTSSMVNNVGMTEDDNKEPTASVLTDATVQVDHLHGDEVTTLVEPRAVKPLLMVPAGLLSHEGGPRFSGKIGKPSKRLMEIARLEHFDAGRELGDITKVRNLLPKALRKSVAPLIQLWPMLSRHHLAGHIFEGPVVNDVVLDINGASPTRVRMDVRGVLGEAEFVDIADPVSGDIMLALRSAGISWSAARNLLGGLTNSVGDADDGGTTSDTGSVSLPGRNRVKAVAAALVAIFGTEFLGIAVGRKYRIRVPVDVIAKVTTRQASQIGLDLAGERRGAALRSRGQGVFVVPENDALRLFAEGELNLPVPVVADAVERWLNGHMNLHRTVAVPLIHRYVQVSAEANHRGEDIGLGKKHYPTRLLEALKKVADIGPAVTPAADAARHDPGKGWVRLDEALTAAQTVNDQLREVVVAPQYEHGMGVSVPESFVVRNRPSGEQVDILDEVMNAVEEALPGVTEHTPNLYRQLRVDLNGARPKVHLEEMWSRRGFEREYDVQNASESQASQVVTIRLRTVSAGDPRLARMVSQTDEQGTIIQRYRGEEATRTESYSAAWSAGLDYSDSQDGADGRFGLSTKRNRSFASTAIRNVMRLLRVARFVGDTTIEQDQVLVLEVSTRPVRVRPVPFERHVPGLAAKIRAKRDATRVERLVVRREYDMTLRRRIPSDMVRPVAQDPGPAPEVIDPRSVELPPGVFPEVLAEHDDKPTLHAGIMRKLKEMIGHAAAVERSGALSAWLSHSGMITGLERVGGPDGQVVAQVAEPRFHAQGVDISVRARKSDLTVVAGPFDGEVGEVDRRAEAQNVSIGRGRLKPAGMSTGNGWSVLGLSYGANAGAQASESVSQHQGARSERSKFESGKLYTVRLRVDYDATFTRVKRQRDGNVKPFGDSEFLPALSSATAMFTLPGEVLATLDAQMQRGIRVAAPMDDLPQFTFQPDPGREGLIQILQDARVTARERGQVASVYVRESDGIHRYLAAPRRHRAQRQRAQQPA